jgi:hypothetical protein
MRWGQKNVFYGHPKWHWFDGDKAVCAGWELDDRSRDGWTFMPADRRPALARNNVCSHCKKAYIATRPDLKGYIDRLNDKKDV